MLAQGQSNLRNGLFRKGNGYEILKRYALETPTVAKSIFGRSARISQPSHIQILNAVTGGWIGDNQPASSQYRCVPVFVI